MTVRLKAVMSNINELHAVPVSKVETNLFFLSNSSKRQLLGSHILDFPFNFCSFKCLISYSNNFKKFELQRIWPINWKITIRKHYKVDLNKFEFNLPFMCNLLY